MSMYNSAALTEKSKSLLLASIERDDVNNNGKKLGQVFIRNCTLIGRHCPHEFIVSLWKKTALN